ncbi:MAG: hypothetical protein IKA44_02350, partial [Clostridia bacterium]|nr:hypothetical protein [Clostridia bacterium]
MIPLPKKGRKPTFSFEKNFQKNEKNFKKGIDKGKVMWYNSQAVARRELRDGERSLKIEQQERSTKQKNK